MSGFGAAAREMVRSTLAYLADGLQVTLRRSSTLKNRVSGEPITNLSLAGAILAGATAVSMTAAKLEGELVADAKFMIAGDATVYTVGSSVDAAADVLAGVPVSPAIVQNASAGAAVTIIQAYADESYNALRGDVDEGATDRKVEGRAKRVRLAAELGKRAPRRGDVLIDGTEEDAVTAIGNSKPGEQISWVVVAGTGT